MKNFMNALEAQDNRKLTENGAEAYASTLDACLDLFGTVGSMRNYAKEQVEQMFSKAYAEDALSTLRMGFYARDIRGGLGERETFRRILLWLAVNKPEDLRQNVKWIPFYGRWDDLYTLVGTVLEDEVINVFKKEVGANGFKSLIWKWFKSPNTSSKESRRLGRWTAKNIFGDNDFENYFPKYRAALKKGRAEVNVVESLMSSGKWGDINYNSLTSYNNIRYINAFLKHDEDRYTDFVVDTSDINGSVLFPYDIITKAKQLMYSQDKKAYIERLVYDKLWNSLPDYQVDSDDTTIAVVDTSGSMTTSVSFGKTQTTALDVAVSLGMYFADRAKGQFKDSFITFSDRPKLQKVVGANIVDKYNNLCRAEWEMSTNIEAVFDLILDTAKNSQMIDGEIPKRILIISDMEFNQCATSRAGKATHTYRSAAVCDYGFITSMKAKFAEAGYTFPQLVFWNVNARGSFHITKDDNGFILVSGASQNGFKAILAGETEVQETIEVVEEKVEDGVVTRSVVQQTMTRKTIDPMAAMLNTVNGDRYSVIKI